MRTRDLLSDLGEAAVCIALEQELFSVVEHLNLVGLASPRAYELGAGAQLWFGPPTLLARARPAEITRLAWASRSGFPGCWVVLGLLNRGT